MLFTTEKIDDIAIVKINLSRATMDSAPEFREYLMRLIENDERNVIVNLAMCDFLDSSFLGALVFGLKKLKAEGGNLKIVIATQAPAGILSLTKMDQVFTVFNNMDDAINSFNI